MGTSSIFNGPKDRNPLLPDDFENGNDDSEDNSQSDNSDVPANWKAAKNAMSKYITNNGGGGRKMRNVAREYVQAAGGSSKLTQKSIAGIKTAISLGGFLSQVKREGIFKTLERFQVEYLGKSVKEVLSSLINVISADSNTKDDGAAKDATTQVLSELYNYIEENDMNLECLDSLESDTLNMVISSYISIYIWKKILVDLGSSFDKYQNNPHEAASIEKDFQDYINNLVSVEVNNLKIEYDSFESPGIAETITSLYMQCYKVLEGSL